MDTVLKYLGIGAIAYFILGAIGTKVVNRLSFKRPRVKWGGITAQGVNLEVQLPIVNTNPVAIPVDRFEGRLRYGNEVVAFLSAVSPFP